MDWKSACIIDNKDCTDITEDVVSIKKDSKTSRFCIVFENSDKEFHYSLDRITYVKSYTALDTKDRFVFIKGRLQHEVKEIIRFEGWCKVMYFDCTKTTVSINDILLIKNTRNELGISNVIDYLIEAASLDENETPSVEEQGFLVSQLKSLDIREDSILDFILKKKTIAKRETTYPIIAPFSSNSSQIESIQNALQSRVSVIQGPPGTGKTQTILNIIANLLIRGKTVAVVSGNNEATRNVYEKLEKENLGFLCAALGNKTNISMFFEKQSTNKIPYELISGEDNSPTASELEIISQNVIDLYNSKQQRAKLKSEIKGLLIEKNFNDKEFESIPPYLQRIEKKFQSSKASLEAAAYIEALFSKRNHRLINNLKLFLHLGIWPTKDFNAAETIDYLQNRFYPKKIHELVEAIKSIDNKFPLDESERMVLEYQTKSRLYLDSFLRSKYKKLENKTFTQRTYRDDRNFINRYPIILSTTYSLQLCKPNDIIFDYVVIDESSQVNIASAAIALASARRAVIVGDSKQLPHVVPNRLKEPLTKIKEKYELPIFVDYVRFSLLESIRLEYGQDVPSVLLNEHYRCDPEIIGFCNKRFYDDKLVIQTRHAEGCGITIVETPSHSALKRTNPRQAEIISSEILPFQESNEDVGIVAPYRDQVSYIREHLRKNDILVDTVHKFQGKERSTIILSTTADRTIVNEDPEHIDFLNDPNLINVAISRAKKRLYVIASSEALSQEGTLLNDLSKYVSYYSENPSKRRTKIVSVFDLMYDDYAPILEKTNRRLLKISEFKSENIIATILNDICKSRKHGLLSFKFNYPLRKILHAEYYHTLEDRNFILAPGTHCDFVVFNNLDKQIVLIVEVDGKQHEGKLQKQRDARKDRLIRSAGLKLVRIKTTDIDAKERIEKQLNSVNTNFR